MEIQDNTRRGTRLLVDVIRERAESDHARPYALIPVSSSVEDGFQEVSYRLLVNASNRCARWIVDNIGMSTNLTSLAYIGPHDVCVQTVNKAALRYQILALAAARTGHVMLFVSPRNSMDAFNALFDEASASILLSNKDKPLIVQEILKHRSMQHFGVPELAELLDKQPVPPTGSTGSFKEWRSRPWILLHTSGSTGIPKVVTIRHGLSSALDAYTQLPVNEAGMRYGNMRVFVPFPPFHISGINYSLPGMVWLDSTVILPPPTPITASLVNSIHELGNVEHSMLAPALVTELSKTEAFLQNLGKLKGITFAGGPLAADTAEIVSKYTTLYNTIGATEYGGLPLLPKSPEHYNFFKFFEEAYGIEFRPIHDGAEQYEMVFVRKQELDLVQGIFVTFPDLEFYHTKDIFSKGPEPGLWKYESRLDDIIVFTNGEKLNPVMMEGMVTTCPEVTGCMITGQGRPKSAMIVELKPWNPYTTREEKLDRIWPTVQRANKTCPNYARIERHMIYFTTPEEGFARAGKGTIQRSQSNKLFSRELEGLYSAAAKSPASKRNVTIDLSSTDATEKSLAQFFCSENDIDTIDRSQDFFTLGVDSSQLVGLARAINASGSRPNITLKSIYDNPTVAKLAACLHGQRQVRDYNDFDSDDENDKATWTSMQHLHDELTRDWKFKESKSAKSFVKSSRLPPIFHPDGGLIAWLQVLGSFLINFNNWGLIYSFGSYQTLYENGYLSGSASRISWIGTVQGALLLIIGVVSGPVFDRGYFPVVLVVAGLGLVFAMMMVSISTKYYQIMLSQGILLGVCAGLLYIPSIAIIPFYFKKRRGLALGLATSGGSIGGIIYPIMFRSILQTAGFGWACRAIAFVALATLSVAACLLRPFGQRATRRVLDVDAFREASYSTFCVAGFLSFAGIFVPVFLCTTYATYSLGVAGELGFDLLAVLNAAQIFGRVGPAILSDQRVLGPEIMTFIGVLGAAILGFSWIAVSNLAGYLVWLVAYGVVTGMVVTLPAAVLPYLCPTMANYGTRLGMLYAASGIGVLISTPIATAAANDSGGFLGAQIWVGCCNTAALAFLSVTVLEAYRRRKLYQGKRSKK